VPGDPHSPAAPLRSVDELFALFHESVKPREAWRVGTEAEKFGVFAADGKPIQYEGDRGVKAILLSLAERHGWQLEREVEGGEVIALRRGKASITLEPGGQLELSGAPQETMHQTCAEFRGHMAELRDISDELGVAWLGLGFHPFAKLSELPWVPKLRYAVMREYLPTRGKHAVDMMQRTATVQANFDYASVDAGLRMLRVGLALSPIVTAMLANSPFVEGRPSGEVSHRARVWLDVDPDRSGLLPFAWRDTLTLRDYVEWALDVPMFLVKRDGKALYNNPQTFRAFLRDGFQGARATFADWESHVNTLFPEVRFKRTLEVRSADGQQTALLCALPSLWTGVYYDDAALAKAEALASRITLADAEKARPDIAVRGLRAKLGTRDVGEWASELMAIAMDGLRARNLLNRAGQDETVHLERLAKLVAKGQSPADVLLEGLDPEQDFLSQVMKKGLV